MNAYRMASKLHEFLCLIRVLTFAREVLPSLCHQWDGCAMPQVSEPGLDPKMGWYQSCCLSRDALCSAFPAQCMQRHSPFSYMWSFYASSLLGWEIPPPLGGELTLVQFIFDIFTLAMACQPAPTDCLLTWVLPQVSSAGKLLLVMLSLLSGTCPLLPHPVIVWGSSVGSFFLVCVLIINTFCLQVKCLQEQS